MTARRTTATSPRVPRRFRALGDVDPRRLPPSTPYPCDDPYVGTRVAGDDFAGTVIGCATPPPGKRGAHFVIGSVASGAAIGRARKQRAARAEALRARYEGEDFDARPARRAKLPRSAPRALDARTPRARRHLPVIQPKTRRHLRVLQPERRPPEPRATPRAPEPRPPSPATSFAPPRPAPRYPAPPGKAVVFTRDGSAYLFDHGDVLAPLLAVHRVNDEWIAESDPIGGVAIRTRGLFVSGRRGDRVEAWDWRSAPIEARAMLDWARRAGANARRPALDEAAMGLTAVPCPVIGAARYEGWPKGAAHSFAEVHRVVAEAVVACHAAWGWAPTGLSVRFFVDNRAMGHAYGPGDGDRHIGLNEKLLASYDLDSIARTVRHELCHHAREELHPRMRLAGAPKRLSSELAHDAIFCKMLGAIDPKVAANREGCRSFTDDVDIEFVAQTVASRGQGIDPSSGAVHIEAGRGRWKFRWEPASGSPGRWLVLSSTSWPEFLARIPAASRGALRIAYRADEPRTLDALLAAIRETSHGRSIAAFLEKYR